MEQDEGQPGEVEASGVVEAASDVTPPGNVGPDVVSESRGASAIPDLANRLHAALRTVFSMRRASEFFQGLPMENLCKRAVSGALKGDGSAAAFSGEIFEHPKYASMVAALMDLCDREQTACCSRGDLVSALRFVALGAEMAVLTNAALPDGMRRTFDLVSRIPGTAGDLAVLFGHVKQLPYFQVAAVRHGISAQARRAQQTQAPATGQPAGVFPNYYRDFIEEMAEKCTVTDLRRWSKQAWHSQNWERVLYFTGLMLRRDMVMSLGICMAYAQALQRFGRLQEALDFNIRVISPLVRFDEEKAAKNARMTAILRRRIEDLQMVAEGFPEDYKQVDDAALARCGDVRTIIGWARAARDKRDWARLEAFQRRIIEFKLINPFQVYAILAGALEEQGKLEEALRVCEEEIRPLLPDLSDSGEQGRRNAWRIGRLKELLRERSSTPLPDGTSGAPPVAPPARDIGVEQLPLVAPPPVPLRDLDAESELAVPPPLPPAVEAIPLNVSRSDLFLQSLSEVAQTWPEDNQRGAGWRLIPANGVEQFRSALDQMEGRLSEAGVNRSTHITFWTAWKSLKLQVSKNRAIKLSTLAATIERLPTLGAGLVSSGASLPDSGGEKGTEESVELDIGSIDGFFTSLLKIAEKWEIDNGRQGEGWRIIPDDMLQLMRDAIARFRGNFELKTKMKTDAKLRNRLDKVEQNFKSGVINMHQIGKLLETLS